MWESSVWHHNLKIRHRVKEQIWEEWSLETETKQRDVVVVVVVVVVVDVDVVCWAQIGLKLEKNVRVLLDWGRDGNETEMMEHKKMCCIDKKSFGNRK